ncbi:MAG: stage II sporulation protein M [Candidatus Hydrogenedentes bacterium]|nr:stage II sporulation protein M [Candidatus Hydrogenedentota bacterium]
MIIDLERFLAEERPYWGELDGLVARLEADPVFVLSLESARRLHYLYRRASADLAKVATFASDPELRQYLESLVARAYGEIHEVRERPHRFAPIHWFFRVFPVAFRKHIWAFWLAVAITIVGSAFGGGAVALDPDAKGVLLPFSHLQIDPSERVAREERVLDEDPREASKAMGTSFYFTHNTKVAIMTLALGIAWGLGTVIVLFANGVMLGAVVLDYALAGETTFLVGWLLPHGAIEIPAILLAGQAGLVLGRALIGWGSRVPVRGRLRAVSKDLVTLIIGVALMLAWAGFVEAFLSQYHEPVIPYSIKIGFGAVELILLCVFLARSGKGHEADVGGDSP